MNIIIAALICLSVRMKQQERLVSDEPAENKRCDGQNNNNMMRMMKMEMKTHSSSELH